MQDHLMARAAPLFISVRQAHQRLGISRSTFYELVGQGRIPVAHLGRRVLVPVAEVDRFAAELVNGK